MKVVKKQPKPKREWRGAVPNIKKYLALALVVIASAAILMWVLPLLPTKPQTQTKSYKGVLELWNVESFEGGNGSRATWITSRAAKFEKQNEGLFVHVSTLTEEQLTQKLAEGEAFDLICFSRGVGSAIFDLLQSYTGSVADICDNLLSAGEVGGRVYAVPVFAGVYCLFARQSQLPQNSALQDVALSATYTQKIGKKTYELSPMICGFSAYICPISALAQSGVHGSFAPDYDISQYSAYEKFTAGKTAVTLLGTQRDLFRLGRREESGKIEPLAFCALSGYTDLVQFVSISATAGNKTDSATKFAEYLVSSAAQKTLVNIGMFSVTENSNYTSERYIACEEALRKAYVPGVFADKSAIEQQRRSAVDALRS